MEFYFRKLVYQVHQISGEVEPTHFGILAVIVVIMGYFLLRGMSIGR